MRLAISNHTFVIRLLALGCLLVASLSQSAWAQKGGTPDAGSVPVLQALRTEVDALHQRFLSVTATVEPDDLPALKQLADELARIDAHFAVTAIGGVRPDLSQTTLNQALLGLRAKTVELRGHVSSVLATVTGVPIFEQITTTRTLRFMVATTRMLTARIDYALPPSMTPPPDL